MPPTKATIVAMPPIFRLTGNCSTMISCDFAALEESAVAEVAVQHIADPDDILLRQGLIEAVLLVQVLERGWRSIFPTWNGLPGVACIKTKIDSDISEQGRDHPQDTPRNVSTHAEPPIVVAPLIRPSAALRGAVIND